MKIEIGKSYGEKSHWKKGDRIILPLNDEMGFVRKVEETDSMIILTVTPPLWNRIKGFFTMTWFKIRYYFKQWD